MSLNCCAAEAICMQELIGTFESQQFTVSETGGFLNIYSTLSTVCLQMSVLYSIDLNLMELGVNITLEDCPCYLPYWIRCITCNIHYILHVESMVKWRENDHINHTPCCPQMEFASQCSTTLVTEMTADELVNLKFCTYWGKGVITENKTCLLGHNDMQTSKIMTELNGSRVVL